MATINQNASIGTTAAQLTGSSTPVKYGTSVKALPGNGAVVYVGYSSAVTAATGYPLSAGDEIFISHTEAPDASTIYLIAASGTQGAAFRAV